MYKFFRKFNWLLLFDVFLLGLIGVLFIYSASFDGIQSSQVYQKQLIWWLIASFAFLLSYRFDFRILGSQAYILYVFSVLLLLAVLLIGNIRQGAQSWFSLLGVSLQPSEISKLAIIFVLARYLSDHYENRKELSFVLIPFLIVFFPMILIVKQPDLGTAMVFVPIIFAMLYASQAKIKYLMGIILLGSCTVPFLWFFLHEYQKKRILVFLNPNIDPLGAGYTAIQSKIAVGSGQFWGKGWLNGTQNQLNFLPERHTDFIFSVLGEEWGFVGCMVVLLLFIILVWQGYQIADQSNEIFSRLLAVGLTTLIGAHVCINIAMTIGLLPITGLPLPFISYGGSNLLIMMISVGFLENIYRRRIVF